MTIEAKKKYEFLESISAIMDAHLRYFKLVGSLILHFESLPSKTNQIWHMCPDLLLNLMSFFFRDMTCWVNWNHISIRYRTLVLDEQKYLSPPTLILVWLLQILTYAQQSKEQSKIEQDRLARRIQEFRTQSELDSQQLAANAEISGVNGNRVVGTIPYKNTETSLTADKEVSVCFPMQLCSIQRLVLCFSIVWIDSGLTRFLFFCFVRMQVIKQGYLLKRSSSLRTDWKRKFFVLDSHGSMYYYRNNGNKSMVRVRRPL